MREDPSVKTVTYNGETHTLREWAQRRDISIATLHYRYEAEWPADEMLGFKIRLKKNVRTVTYDGETLTISQWSKRLKTHATSMHVRWLAGYSPAQILGFEPIPRSNYFIRSARVYTRSDGVSGTLGQWEAMLGKSRKTLEARLRRGWDIDRALELGRDAPASPLMRRIVEEGCPA